MANQTARIFCAAFVTAALGTSSLWARPSGREGPVVRRDYTYEQDLRWQAGADQAITPAKVLRWLRGMTQTQILSSSTPEFQPIVNVHNSRVRLIAAIAFKF